MSVFCIYIYLCISLTLILPPFFFSYVPTEPKWSDWTLRMDEKVAKLMETLEKGNRFEGLEAALQAQQEAEDKVREMTIYIAWRRGGRGRERQDIPFPHTHALTHTHTHPLQHTHTYTHLLSLRQGKSGCWRTCPTRTKVGGAVRRTAAPSFSRAASSCRSTCCSSTCKDWMTPSGW